MSFIDTRTKISRLAGLMDKVVNNNLSDIIDSMIDKDPRLLSRLNFGNRQVASHLIDRLKGGKIKLTDLTSTR